MTTWAKLIDQCENAVNDENNSTWTVKQIIKWINDAVRDYSVHFPLVEQQTIALSTGTQFYDLRDEFMGILHVEYPTGSDPKDFLTRLPRTHADFWSEQGYYDLVDRRESGDPSSVIISSDVATGESANALQHLHHVLIEDANDKSGTVTVPVQHQALLVKYVQWQATTHLAFAEQQSPTSNSSLLMAQLAQNARRMELSYSTALQQAIYAADGESRPLNWMTKESGMERVY